MVIFLGFALGAVTVWACMKLRQWDKEETEKAREKDALDKDSRPSS